MASHTWNFYLTAGRTFGGPRISGASIVAYTTSTGSSVRKSLVTNSNGYATYKLTGNTVNPSIYYWRVNIGSVYGDYYGGEYIVGEGDSSGYYGTPSATFNTQGASLISSSYNSVSPTGNYTRTVYFYIVGTNVSISSYKYLTWFDVELLVPPTYNYLSSGTTQQKLNTCLTGVELYENYYVDDSFYDSLISQGSNLVERSAIEPYTSFISGSSITPTLSPTSLSFTYSASGSGSIKSVTGTCSSFFIPTVFITGNNSSDFNAYISSLSSTSSTYTFAVNICPNSANNGSSNRTALASIRLSKIDDTAWFEGTFGQASIALSQSYYQSGGGGSQT